MTYSELVKSRYSCRKFSDKPVEDEKLNAILQAGISAPTAKNVQPVKIWVIKSPDSLAKIKSCNPFVWMKNVPVVLAVGGTTEGAFVRPSDNRNFEDVDATIVATHMMLAVEAEGLGTTWIGMKDYDLVALFPIGYPADDAMPSDRHYLRKSMAEIVSFI